MKGRWPAGLVTLARRHRGGSRAARLAVPAPPAPGGGLSIWQPIHLGTDEGGTAVWLGLVERNMLIGGEPGGGKSSALNLIVGHAALSTDCRLVLLDGKQVEFGLWRSCADLFIGPDLGAAVAVLQAMQAEMDRRYALLLEAGDRKIHPGVPGLEPIVVAVDEVAYYSATAGTKSGRDTFTALLRDLVARGRAAGVITVAATQRPTAEVVSPSLRDLFGYRWAFRCTTPTSSDVILGNGYAKQGYSATEIDPAARCRLAAGRGRHPAADESGVPHRRRHPALGCSCGRASGPVPNAGGRSVRRRPGQPGPAR